MQSEISDYPPARLCCTRNQNRFKWYIVSENGRHYLPKRERPLAEKLACKKYLSLKLREVESELKALQCYLSHHNTSINLITSYETNDAPLTFEKLDQILCTYSLKDN